MDFGPIRLDANYTFSLWVKPDLNSSSHESPEMNILTKIGVSEMNHFRLYKQGKVMDLLPLIFMPMEMNLPLPMQPMKIFSRIQTGLTLQLFIN